MSRELNRFDWIASHYDSLTRLLFGGAVFDSQACFLNSIPAGAHVLVLGGGAGKLLLSLVTRCPSCRVVYVEASSAMLALARKAITASGQENVDFIHGTEKSIPPATTYDAIITGFVLDVFPPQQLAATCGLLFHKLKQGGVWLATDFVNGGKWWHGVLLRVMYKFFLVTRSIESKALPPWEACLRATGMQEKGSRLFFGGFIKALHMVREGQSGQSIRRI